MRMMKFSMRKTIAMSLERTRKNNQVKRLKRNSKTIRKMIKKGIKSILIKSPLKMYNKNQKMDLRQIMKVLKLMKVSKTRIRGR